jgi:cell division control protein 6
MKAGDLARDEDTQTVTEDHVERGRRELERGRIKEGITGLTQHGHLVLYALLTLDLEGEAPVRSRDVRPRYTRFTEMADRDPLVPRRMRDHLSELAMLGIVSVTERNEGRRGGTYREYAIDMDIDLLLDAIEDTVREVGVHQSVQQFLVNDELDHGETDLSDFAPESH